MRLNSEFTKNVPKVAFLFIIYVIIAGNYTTHVLSCQMQQFLETSIISRHIMGILVFFFFIMLEGGWDFDQNVLNEDVNNWASGNTVHSLIYACILYFIFIIIARGKLASNIVLFLVLFLLYMLNVNTTYLSKRKRIEKNTELKIRKVEKVLVVLSVMIFAYGFIDYFLYKIEIHGGKFNLIKFLLGTVRCDYKKYLNLQLVEKLK